MSVLGSVSAAASVLRSVLVSGVSNRVSVGVWCQCLSQ